MQTNDLLLTIIGIVLGGAIYYKTKATSAGALLDNTASKESLNKEDQNISKDCGLLDAEEAKRKALQAEVDNKTKKAQDETIKNLLDMFNSPK